MIFRKTPPSSPTPAASPAGDSGTPGEPGKASALEEQLAALNGPGAPLTVHPKPVEGARLSQKGKAILFGGGAIVSTLIIVGIMTAGQDPAAQGAQAQADGAARAGAAAAPNIEELERQARRAQLEQEILAGRAQPGDQLAADAQAGAAAARPAAPGGQPTPSEKHRAWLVEHHYNRIQSRVLAADAAAAAPPMAGGSAGAGGGGAQARAVPVGLAGAGAGGLEAQLAAMQQRMADGQARAADARGQAALAQAALAQPQPPQGGPAPRPPAGGPAPAGVATDRDPAVAQQQRNRAFLAQESDPSYLDERVRPQLGTHELAAGSIIPAVLVTGVNSDLPGALIAQVRANVFDSFRHDVLVIPSGSRLIGRYASDVGYGQNRLLVAWDEVIFPNGRRLRLGGMQGADAAGQSGLRDQVHTHFWRTWSSAFLVSILGAAAQQAQPQQSTALQPVPASATATGAAADALNEVGTRILERNLNVSPTLVIRPGFVFNVMVNQSVVMEAYDPAAQRR